MARQDIAGLLTGISSDRPDPMTMGGNSAQQRLAFGAQRGQNLQRGVRGMMGGNTMTNAEQLQMAMAQLDLSNPADLAKLAKIQQATGDLAGAAQTASKMKAMQQAKIDETRAVAREERNVLSGEQQTESFNLSKEDRARRIKREAVVEERAIAREEMQDRTQVLREEQAARQVVASERNISEADTLKAQNSNLRVMYEAEARSKGKEKLADLIKGGMPLATASSLLYKTSTAQINEVKGKEANGYRQILLTPVMQGKITSVLEDADWQWMATSGGGDSKLTDDQEDALFIKTKEIATREQITIEEAMVKAIKVLTALETVPLTPAQIEAERLAAEQNALLNGGPSDDDSDDDPFGDA